MEQNYVTVTLCHVITYVHMYVCMCAGLCDLRAGASLPLLRYGDGQSAGACLGRQMRLPVRCVQPCRRSAGRPAAEVSRHDTRYTIRYMLFFRALKS